ncbi:hypothetical protein LGM71_17785 [Burkholderia sp. AU33545]|uniref:hypothetical protein n=1 Tax=Burkholderia sp. AU33545 TaxID=2879631 RepID=UPI001CF449C5|nr:hypothetical protein [Burkholderia sp. AU33545]MCA8202913.1 hypothetical protein [Burkholderia sp. AU33545]
MPARTRFSIPSISACVSFRPAAGGRLDRVYALLVHLASQADEAIRGDFEQAGVLRVHGMLVVELQQQQQQQFLLGGA